MATLPYHITPAQRAAQENVIKNGLTTEGYGATGEFNLFTAGVPEAFIEKAVIFKFRKQTGKHFLNTYLKIFGANRSFPVYGSEHSWFEMGRTRKGLTVLNVVSGDTTPSLVIEATSTTDVRYRVNDILQTDRLNGFTMLVTAVNDSVSPAQYTVQKRDRSNWAAATEMVAGDLLGYNHNAWGEGTGQPDGLRYSPEAKTNKLVLIKETDGYTGNAITTKTELELPNGSKVYADQNRLLMFDRFLEHRENAYMWAEETADDDANPSGRGIYQDILANSTASTDYGASLVEADFQDQILLHKAENASDLFLGLCGMSSMGGAQTALKDYVVDGSVDYGSFSLNKGVATGLNIRQYHYNGVTFEFHNYRGFDERNVTGFSGGAAATTNNFRDFIMLLNMGEGAGTAIEGGQSAGAMLNTAAGVHSTGMSIDIPYLSHVYRALGDVDRSLVVGFLKGMTGKFNSVGGGNFDVDPQWASWMQNQVATDIDQDKLFVLSEVGVRMPCVDVAHGYMRKSA